MFGAGNFREAHKHEGRNRDDDAKPSDRRSCTANRNYQAENHSCEQAAEMRRVEGMIVEPLRQESEDYEKSEKDDDDPTPLERGGRHALQKIRPPERAHQTEGYAARTESVVLGRKSDQLRLLPAMPVRNQSAR